MGKTCHDCGRAISLEDLEQRRAVIVMRRAYCDGCSDHIAATGVRKRRENRPMHAFDILALPDRLGPRLLAAAVVTVALAALLALAFLRR